VQRPEIKTLSTRKRVLAIAACLCFLMIGAQVLPSVLIRQTTTVTILRNDAARECRSRTIFKIWKKYRSSTPEMPFAYCGAVMSDHGSFVLPETVSAG
jgi:hypothetical protein